MGPPRGPGSSKGSWVLQGVLGTPGSGSSKGSWVLQGVLGPPGGFRDTGIWVLQGVLGPPRSFRDTKTRVLQGVLGPPRSFRDTGIWVLQGVLVPPRCPHPLLAAFSDTQPCCSPHPPIPHIPPQPHVTATRVCKNTHVQDHACSRPLTPRSLTCPIVRPFPPPSSRLGHACPRRLRPRAAHASSSHACAHVRTRVCKAEAGCCHGNGAPTPPRLHPRPPQGLRWGAGAPCKSLALLHQPHAAPLHRFAPAVCTPAVRNPGTNAGQPPCKTSA